MCIVEKLALRAKQTPDKLAVIFEGEEITFAGLWNKTVRCAHLFRKLGLREGDRIVLQSKYSVYYAASIYAAHLCGAAAVPVDKNADDAMIADMAEHIDARLAVCNQKGERSTSCVLYNELATDLPEDTSMDGLAFPDSESIAAILFTTGTTGAPKGVQITQRNIMGWVENMGSTENDVFLAAVPLNHAAPFMRLHRSVFIGGTVIFMENMMKIGRLFEYVEKYGVTALYFPPSAIALLQRLSKERLAKYAAQLRYIFSGSAAMTAPQQNYLKNMLPQTPLYTTYGSSESGIITLYRYDNSDRPINCCGKAFPCIELRIVDDAFQPLPTGQAGMIAIRSDMVMKGYYKLPELNDSVLHDGFFISNDLGYLDEEGYLYVLGRSDDMINIGGLKVFPSEIENAALRIPGVEECICFSIPDPITGQSGKLLIKPGDTFSASVPQVQETLRRSMDSYKVPKYIEFVTEIRKTANGKPDRKYYRSQE